MRRRVPCWQGSLEGAEGAEVQTEDGWPHPEAVDGQMADGPTRQSHAVRALKACTAS